jgi:hypothetical protein
MKLTATLLHRSHRCREHSVSHEGLHTHQVNPLTKNKNIAIDSFCKMTTRRQEGIPAGIVIGAGALR